MKLTLNLLASSTLALALFAPAQARVTRIVIDETIALPIPAGAECEWGSDHNSLRREATYPQGEPEVRRIWALTPIR